MTTADRGTGGECAADARNPVSGALGEALLRLGGFVSGLTWSGQEAVVRAALARIVFDSVVVTMAGGRLAEVTAPSAGTTVDQRSGDCLRTPSRD